MRWIFSIYVILQPHYDLGVNSVSNGNEYQESSWKVRGGQHVRLTTLPPHVSLNASSLWACTACYRDSFFFTLPLPLIILISWTLRGSNLNMCAAGGDVVSYLQWERGAFRGDIPLHTLCEDCLGIILETLLKVYSGSGNRCYWEETCRVTVPNILKHESPFVTSKLLQTCT
jgi:hypothetical protein